MLSAKYHPNTYVYYGADPKQKSFMDVTWRIKRGREPDGLGPTLAQVQDQTYQQVRMDGKNPEYVGGERKTRAVVTPIGVTSYSYEASDWELHCEMQDGIGDGTVPQSSGASPRSMGGSAIKQQFRLAGFDHEESYKNSKAQMATLYAINKIVGAAKKLG